MTVQTTKKYKIGPEIRINRNARSGTYLFKDIFTGFEKLEAVRRIFADRTDELLSKLKVEIFPRKGFMGVSDEDGHIFASQYYVREGELWSVYLDTIHELVHVRQFMEGKNLFDPSFSYVDRPTEIEAYLVGTNEARRIGLTEQEIFEYLEVPWISKDEQIKLAKACNIMINRVRQEDNSKRSNARKK